MLDSQTHTIGSKITELLQRTGHPELVNDVVTQLSDQSAKHLAQVSFAGRLSQDQKDKINSKVRSLFADVSGIEYQEKPELIAGIVIRYADYEYENSLRSHFRSLHGNQPNN